MSGDESSSPSPSRGGLHIPTAMSMGERSASGTMGTPQPVPKKSPMFVRRGAPPIAPGQDEDEDSDAIQGELSSSNQDSERTGGTTAGNLPTEDIPFPGLYDKVFRFFGQKSWPRYWCIQLICWSYPFYVQWEQVIF